MIRVLIADDHRIARHGISRILETAGDIEVVSEAGSDQQVLEAAGEAEIDVVLLDAAMPDGNGLNIFDELYRRKPDIKVLVLDMYSSRQFVQRAMELRAHGYLTKDSAPGELITAIRTVARGGRYFTPARTVEYDQNARPGHLLLSEREFQILDMLAAGKSPTEIGKELGLSIKTVSTYRARIMTKLKLKNTAEIIRYAIKHGLTE